MRKIKEILRLRHEIHLSIRDIALALHIGFGTVVDYLKRAEQAGLGWPLPADLQERDLGRLLFPTVSGPRHRFIDPDYPGLHLELKRNGVTLFLLWEEYREQHPDDGYSYSQFCYRYAAWRDRQKPSMRQVHRAGEKMFVDYSGPTMPVVNPDSGEVRDAQIFVAVLGASSFTFACAHWSQRVPDWIDAHARAFSYFDGVPEIVVPDNLKSAVIKTHRYEPDLNASYQQMAAHFGVAIVPARSRKPQDKAKAEVAVQIVERWILARLRHHTFFTLAALNQAISDLLEDLNARPFQKLPGTRASLFELLDRPVLRPLPSQAYEYLAFKQARVHIDYHVEFEKHYYSVPHQLLKRAVEIQAGVSTVAIYHAGLRVACHARSMRAGAHTTCVEHMPEAHQRMLWGPERLLSRAADIGAETRALVEHLLQERRHREQSYRRVLALLGNADKYGAERLNNACGRALLINSPTRASVESILKQKLDLNEPANDDLELGHHENIRGETYYH